MTERSRFWTGTTTGDAVDAPYDAPTEFSQVLRDLAGAGWNENQSGVFRDDAVLNELVPTPGVGLVNIGIGRALVYGGWYETDAAVNVAVPTPAGATRLDRIVVRKSWTAQTIRLVRIAGVEGGGVPLTTKILGDTWDMNLALISVTTGGVITLVTDERNFLGLPSNPMLDLSNNLAIALSTQIQTPPGIPWQVENYKNVSSMHSTSVNPERVYIPRTGLYAISLEVSYSNEPLGLRGLWLWKNTTILLREYWIDPNQGGFSTFVDLYIEVILRKGDYIEVNVGINSGAGVSTVVGNPVIGPLSPKFIVRLIQPVIV